LPGQSFSSAFVSILRRWHSLSEQHCSLDPVDFREPRFYKPPHVRSVRPGAFVVARKRTVSSRSQSIGRLEQNQA